MKRELINNMRNEWYSYHCAQLYLCKASTRFKGEFSDNSAPFHELASSFIRDGFIKVPDSSKSLELMNIKASELIYQNEIASSSSLLFYQYINTFSGSLISRASRMSFVDYCYKKTGKLFWRDIKNELSALALCNIYEASPTFKAEWSNLEFSKFALDCAARVHEITNPKFTRITPNSAILTYVKMKRFKDRVLDEMFHLSE